MRRAGHVQGPKVRGTHGWTGIVSVEERYTQFIPNYLPLFMHAPCFAVKPYHLSIAKTGASARRRNSKTRTILAVFIYPLYKAFSHVQSTSKRNSKLRLEPRRKSGTSALTNSLD